MMVATYSPLLIFALVLSSVLPVKVSVASASTTGLSSSSYVSVRALDRYGHSEQLQNALKAANLQGTLVVAARDPSRNSTIVLSLLEAPKKTGKILKDPTMLHLLNNNPAFIQSSTSTPISTALICTGLKGDARWLISNVRKYSHRVWERYNQFLDTPGAALAVSKFTRKFWGYDEKSEWQPGLLDQQSRSEDESREYQWGRPLGVVTMIISSSLPYIFVVDPSGVVQRYTAFATGKRSRDVLERLPEVIDDNASEPSNSEQKEGLNSSEEHHHDGLKERLIYLMQDLFGSTNKEMDILIEELSAQGVNRTLIPLGN